jgi:hypothetical protein
MQKPKFKVGDRVVIGIELELLTLSGIKGRAGIIVDIRSRHKNDPGPIRCTVKFDDNDNGRLPEAFVFAPYELELQLNALQKLKKRYAKQV